MTDQTDADQPKVSIVATTHNQEAYVRETFDGFVSQQTDFPLEIIVADDASTDSTREIIQEYTDRYPDLFRPILRPENLGLNANLRDALSAARGEYIALCEGDDYWTDPLKLSKQVAVLDDHPETAVCFHPVRVIWTGVGHSDETFAVLFARKMEETFFPKFPPALWAGNRSLEVLISRNFIQTNSVMYRRLPRYDDIPADVMPLDWYLHVRHAVHGDIAMLPETMAVYRRHPHGMWYNAIVDPARFWLTQGLGHAATFDAMFDLVAGNPEHEEIVAKNANALMRKIRRTVPEPDSRALLVDIVAKHPRIGLLALQNRWARTPVGRLKTLRRKLVAVARHTKTGASAAAGSQA